MGGPDPGAGDLMTMRILITGVTGQDGSLLAELLTRDPVNIVYGMVRGEHNRKLDWIQRLAPRLSIVYGDLTDPFSLHRVLGEVWPDVIYNLGALSAPNT